MCDYVIAPVARYAGHWGIPVLTPGAQADAFRHKNQQYSTLTRLAGKTKTNIYTNEISSFKRCPILFSFYNPVPTLSFSFSYECNKHSPFEKDTIVSFKYYQHAQS